MTKFTELGLSKPVLTALTEAGYKEPTEIQSRTIDVILSGKDLVASAQTGSGKTAAFALPIIDCLEEPAEKPRALVLTPTRELALQVAAQFELFGKYSGLRVVTLYGGTSMAQQVRALRNPVDIVVATPGRLIDCLERRFVDLRQVEILVLDEADRLLDFGFAPQLRRIKTQLPKERQTLLFSATIDRHVAHIAGDFTCDPATVKVQGKTVEAESIEQKFLHVHEFGKDALLLQLLNDMEASSILVFTRTKRKATWVKDRLRDANVAAEEIHSDISQAQRERTLRKYRAGEFAVLVATDVAARGLDIPSISHVINYDLPDTPHDYVHRIGRTGRAGRAGTAFSFISHEQSHLVRDIEKVVGRKLDDSPVPLRKTLSGRRFGRRR
ncbi:MAG TPA: DEAD/DEAH box helicase [Candidatus Obscuribacterales bacterium]